MRGMPSPSASDPSRLVQSSAQWAMLVAWPDEPVRYDMVGSVIERAGQDDETGMAAYETLRARGLLAVSRTPSSRFRSFTVSERGRAALDALGTDAFPEGLTFAQAREQLAHPVAMPVRRRAYDDGEIDYYTLERAAESAFEDGQAGMARWCADVLARVRA